MSAVYYTYFSSILDGLYAKEFTFDKILSINRLFTRNWLTRTKILLAFIPHICYSSYQPSIAASKTWSLTTLFSTKMRAEETQPQEHQHTCLSNL